MLTILPTKVPGDPVLLVNVIVPPALVNRNVPSPAAPVPVWNITVPPELVSAIITNLVPVESECTMHEAVVLPRVALIDNMHARPITATVPDALAAIVTGVLIRLDESSGVLPVIRAVIFALGPKTLSRM